MKKYLKEVVKFIVVLIVIILGLSLILSLYTNSIRKANDEFAKSDQIAYKKNVNRIEYEYSNENLENVQKEKVKDPDRKDSNIQIYYKNQTEDKLPLIIWTTDKDKTSEDYELSLESLASYGFLVVVNEGRDLGDGQSIQDLIDSLHTLNSDKNFSLYQKVDLDKIGLAGHGLGACETVQASYIKDNQAIKSLFLTSLPKLGALKNNFLVKDRSKLAYDMSKVKTPCFITSGSGKIDSFYSPLEAISEEINVMDKYVEAYGAIRKKYDDNLVNNYHPLGYMNAWFAYTLKRDTTAANAFIVREEIKNNPAWAWVKDNR